MAHQSKLLARYRFLSPVWGNTQARGNGQNSGPRPKNGKGIKTIQRISRMEVSGKVWIRNYVITSPGSGQIDGVCGCVIEVGVKEGGTRSATLESLAQRPGKKCEGGRFDGITITTEGRIGGISIFNSPCPDRHFAVY